MTERSITEIKSEIEAYNRLSILRKIAKMAIGRNPDPSDKEQLRRYELGSTGRNIENIERAIRYTKKLNRVPAAVLGGAWKTTPHESPNGGSGIIFFDELEDSFKGNIKQGIKELAKTKNLESHREYTGFGVFLDVDNKYYKKEDVKGLGIVLVTDKGDSTGTIVFSKTDVDSLPTDLQEKLEDITSLAGTYMVREYYINKPENIG